MGAYTLLQDLTVATDSTSVVMDDFGTITKDDFYKVVATFVNTSGSENRVDLTANTATTLTNYHSQFLIGLATTVAAGRDNFPRFSTTNGSKTSTLIGYLKISENDRFNVFLNYNAENDTAIRNGFAYSTSSGATFTSGIDTLTFTGNQTNGIGTGSRIQIYKLDAEKVADITVATNTTQVDISSLSIDKDSEYLLVSDITNNSGSGNYYQLFINDTTSGYVRQGIFGNGSTASASRSSINDIVELAGNGVASIYTHIKLSNIGAYTNQSYAIREVGTSGIRLENYFGSTTSEAITSVTKISINSTVSSNGIKTGSRFILYKLYE